jgi:Rieske Fe-S protein
MTSSTHGPGPSRRRLLQVGGAGLLVTGALAACGDDDDDDDGPEVEPGSGAARGSGGGAVEVPAAEVPEGGAVFREGDHVIVSQPSPGDFRAFDATCPHEGCAVSRTDGADLLCPCHGSRFRMDTGEVVRGPAERALTGLTVEVEGDTVRVRR